MKRALSICILLILWNCNSKQEIKDTNTETVYDRVLQFSGIEWTVKREDSYGPGPNYWSDDIENIWVDPQGNLHLMIRKVGDTWHCSEIISQESFGYGAYTFQLSSNVEKYNPNVVVGLFTYENLGPDKHNEIDIEFSQWGSTSNVFGGYTIPFSNVRLHSFALDLKTDYSTHTFNWQPEKITFSSYQGHDTENFNSENLISTWEYFGEVETSPIPTHNNEKLRINFYFYGEPPTDTQDIELIIKSVSVPE